MPLLPRTTEPPAAETNLSGGGAAAGADYEARLDYWGTHGRLHLRFTLPSTGGLFFGHRPFSQDVGQQYLLYSTVLTVLGS